MQLQEFLRKILMRRLLTWLLCGKTHRQLWRSFLGFGTSTSEPNNTLVVITGILVTQLIVGTFRYDSPIAVSTQQKGSTLAAGTESRTLSVSLKARWSSMRDWGSMCNRSSRRHGSGDEMALSTDYSTDISAWAAILPFIVCLISWYASMALKLHSQSSNWIGGVTQEVVGSKEDTGNEKDRKDQGRERYGAIAVAGLLQISYPGIHYSVAWDSVPLSHTRGVCSSARDARTGKVLQRSDWNLSKPSRSGLCLLSGQACISLLWIMSSNVTHDPSTIIARSCPSNSCPCQLQLVELTSAPDIPTTRQYLSSLPVSHPRVNEKRLSLCKHHSCWV